MGQIIYDIFYFIYIYIYLFHLILNETYIVCVYLNPLPEPIQTNIQNRSFLEYVRKKCPLLPVKLLPVGILYIGKFFLMVKS